jgi:hypothetical protein
MRDLVRNRPLLQAKGVSQLTRSSIYDSVDERVSLQHGLGVIYAPGVFSLMLPAVKAFFSGKSKINTPIKSYTSR